MQIALHYIRTADVDSEEARAAHRTRLTPAEREMETRYTHKEARLAFLITRALVRSLLAEYLSVSPGQLVFAVGPHGKPRLVRPDARLAFNVSHAHGAIVCAIAFEGEVGVDIERCDRHVNLALAERYFAAEEAAQVFAAPPERQSRRFLEFWTLKEAFIKALGTGLATSLQSFAFTLEPPPVRLTLHDERLGPFGRWSFAQCLLAGDEYYAAVALDSDRTHELQLLRRRCSTGLGPFDLT